MNLKIHLLVDTLYITVKSSALCGFSSFAERDVKPENLNVMEPLSKDMIYGSVSVHHMVYKFNRLTSLMAV